ncbi:MAG TPA: DUF1015 domain-containing protein [Phycisphaerales bacterium]|nr:DUF1015 domain-containing protein [Phycisphaerales bacterium]
MPAVHPFRAVQYAEALAGRAERPADLSRLVAPPYDVLDADSKAALLKQDQRNIVRIDLPHLPAKELGPTEAYEQAARTFRQWLDEGVLARRGQPVLLAYRQRFEFGGARHLRTGMACTLETHPFGPRAGGGVLPHEETFSGPKEDRLALMTATGAQFSPIFGLHPDEDGRATALIGSIMSRRGPDVVARTEAGFGGPVDHEVWTLSDSPTIREYAQALQGQDVFIADGHHRYTTALNYLRSLESREPVGPDHPARRCLFVLVSMSDPGMVIGPTHRVLGGMSQYSLDAFERAAAGKLVLRETRSGLAGLEREMAAAGGPAKQGVLGLYDFATGRCLTATPANPDPLERRFPERVRAWRTLDVALVQHLVVEEICQPALNGGRPVAWAFPHSLEEVAAIGAGQEKGSGGGKAFTPQLAVIVRPTPLEAVREVSRAGELMPQKSTFFYPKLATGLFMNSLS